MVLDVFRVQDGAGLPYGQAEPRRLNALIEALEKAARGEGRIGKAPAPAGNARGRAPWRSRVRGASAWPPGPIRPLSKPLHRAIRPASPLAE